MWPVWPHQSGIPPTHVKAKERKKSEKVFDALQPFETEERHKKESEVVPKTNIEEEKINTSSETVEK